MPDVLEPGTEIGERLGAGIARHLVAGQTVAFLLAVGKCATGGQPIGRGSLRRTERDDEQPGGSEAK
jgi:hypothetical protein